MRKFSSYGPINKHLHYYAPRKALIEKAQTLLVGEAPGQGGSFITVWAPRQTGKTWIMQEVVKNINAQGKFQVGIISMQSAGNIESEEEILAFFVQKLEECFNIDPPVVKKWDTIYRIFRKPFFSRPVILIVDEFDAVREDFINNFSSEFRYMYIRRQNELESLSEEKNILLHGLALVGVRSVLGVENVSGSPFNVQRSLHVPNLTHDEVKTIFQWYEQESGQKVMPEVVEKVYCETRGQPGLACWLGELLTEGFDDYRPDRETPISPDDFDYVYRMAIQALPNSNILNLISKARQAPYRDLVLKLFKTDKKLVFRYDQNEQNFLFLNGITDVEKTRENLFVRFSSPFVQKRLFHYFSEEFFEDVGKLFEPFEDLSDTVDEKGLNIPALMRRFEAYLVKNKQWLLKDAPRRKDLRIFEAVYHFILYRYLCDFLGTMHAKVWPEFPSGNGKIDLLIMYAGKTYALEVKSFTNQRDYHNNLEQAARYGKQLGLSHINLVLFVESVDDVNRKTYENRYRDDQTGVEVRPVFIETQKESLG